MTTLVGDKRADYDLVVLGSSSAAFAGAITATESGARVALVEANVVGGTCVNAGCVPSKAMLAPADLYFRAGHHPFTRHHHRRKHCGPARADDNRRRLGEVFALVRSNFEVAFEVPARDAHARPREVLAATHL
ncbi:MAG: FAD-dependent oxidoreductase [Candidatus Dormibacteria bacterium]